LNDGAGWGTSPGFGLDLEWSFSLQKVVGYLAGVSTYTATVPSSSEFSSLFQEYKIDSIEMSMFYSNNNSSLNTPATSLPLINIAFDPNDVNQTPLSTIQQLSGVRQIQLGNGSDPTKPFVFKPRAALQVYETAIASAYISERTGWINSTYLDVPHYGVKIVYDPTTVPGTSTAIGAVAFYFKLNFSCKGVQ